MHKTVICVMVTVLVISWVEAMELRSGKRVAKKIEAIQAPDNFKEQYVNDDQEDEDFQSPSLAATTLLAGMTVGFWAISSGVCTTSDCIVDCQLSSLCTLFGTAWGVAGGIKTLLEKRDKRVQSLMCPVRSFDYQGK